MLGSVVALLLGCHQTAPQVAAPPPPEIVYPLDETIFPPDIAAPTIRWKSGSGVVDAWRVTVGDGSSSVTARVGTTEWTPTKEQWTKIRELSREKMVKVSVRDEAVSESNAEAASASVSITTSADEVGAPLFYREVNLPFVDAVKDPSNIRWRFGSIDSEEPPPVVLEKLPVCGNCHSFSADGSTFGMDIDYANDKGSYVITDVAEEMVLGKEAVITWSDYARADGEVTLGLLSQISPSGRYVVGTVKDKSVFLTRPDLAYSQLFFPMRGILAYYDTEAKVFGAVPGAADRDYVQSNPAWSPDEKHLVFAKHRAEVLGEGRFANSAFAKRERANEFVDRRKLFRFDLHKVPFNGGRGGDAVPIPGASNNERSNYFAKYSPDGRWIVFCQADSFMLLQADSELYIMEAKGGRPRRMNCNT